MLHTAAFDRHLARREMDRLGKLNGMIKRVHLVRLTVRVCALAEILFYADGRGLLAISAAIRVPGLSFASTKGKPAPVLVVHGKVTSIAALIASTCVRKPKHRRQARTAPSVLENSIFVGGREDDPAAEALREG
jgi:hypothetical protein